jgi:hypothetical protein
MNTAVQENTKRHRKGMPRYRKWQAFEWPDQPRYALIRLHSLKIKWSLRKAFQPEMPGRIGLVCIVELCCLCCGVGLWLEVLAADSFFVEGTSGIEELASVDPSWPGIKLYLVGS